MKFYTCLLLLLLTSPLLAQTTRYVTATGTNTNQATATSWANSTADLQGAINASVPGDQVWVAAGVYKPTTTTGPASRIISFTLKNGVAVYGGFMGNETTLSQRPAMNPVAGQPSSSTLSGEIGDPTSLTDNSNNVVSTTGLTGSAVLDGFVITAGKADGSAGTYPVSNGGGMYNMASSPTLRNLSFVNNQVSYDGAGMYNIAGSNPVITNCLFSGNSAFNGYGGAMLNSGSNPVLTNVSFVRNSSGASGGGMYNRSGSSPKLTNSSFVSNFAFGGGGLGNGPSGSVTLVNVAFIANQALYNGGGINNEGSGLQLTNVSFLNNKVAASTYNAGGAIAGGSNITLTNCVLFGNGGSNSIQGSGLTATYCIFENTITGYSSNATNLTTAVSPFAATNGVALAACSPAINAGLNSASGLTGISTDLAGNPRQVGARVDMGAVEFQASPSSPARLYVNASASGANTGLSWADALTDLQSALMYPCSQSLAEIWVAGGVYKPTQTTGPVSRSISFTMLPGVAIYGGFVGNETTLSQRPAMNPVAGQPSSTTLSGEIGDPTSLTDNSYHVVSTTGLTNSAVLDGFMITAGYADGSGATGFGAGMYNTASSPTLQNLSFLRNKAGLQNGGGVHNTSASNPVITNCLFSGNSASNGYGGGVSNNNSSPLLTNVSFVKNDSYSGGGGMYNTAGSSPRLTNVAFVSNTSTSGGGLYNTNSDTRLINVAFIANQSVNNGGGLHLNGGNPQRNEISNLQLTNVSFLNNQVTSPSSGGGGGAIYNSSFSPGKLTLANGVLFGNGGSISIVGSVTATYSLFENTVTGYGSSATNLTTAVSPFAATNGVALAACSPAINAGLNSATGLTGISTDLSGNPRLVGARVDMGAVEFQASPGSPARLYVNASATGGNTGLSWADALTDLQSALTYPCSQSLTEVWVAAGVYKPTLVTYSDPASRSISFTMLPGVAIYGGFVGNETTLSQRPAMNPVAGQPSSTTLSGEIGDPTSLTDNSYNVVSTTGLTGSALLDGFVITAGYADGTSVYSTGFGAGMYNTASSPTLRNLSFINNKAVFQNGGGMYNVAGSNPAISNCLFSGNYAIQGYGGGISNDGSSPVLTNVAFVRNGSYSGGGGMNNRSASSPRLANVSFVSNGSSYGGGIYSSSSSPTLINVAFINNTGGYNGGGLYNTSSNAQLTNVSFLSNQAPNLNPGFGGGAIYNGSSSVALTNCVLFGNGGSNSIQGSGLTATYSLFDNTVTGYGSSPTNLSTAVSPFAATNGVALAACSPAINAGSNWSFLVEALYPKDLANNPRKVGGQIDIGAVEFQSTPTSPGRLYVNASSTGGNTGLSWADALTDLQSALTYPCSQSLTEVWVAAGLYKPSPVQYSDPASRTISFMMPANIAIYGGFVGNETALNQRPAVNPVTGQPSSSTLSGEIGDPASTTDNTASVVSTTALTTTALLDGFVITAGASYGGTAGGGIKATGGTPRFSNILLQKNRASSGGGMYNSSNSVLTNVVFQSNTALADGGGIFNNTGAQTFINVLFQSNYADNGFGGGGMFNWSGTQTLINTAFLNNLTRTSLYGGGIYNRNCSPVLINVSMQGNRASSGGAIYNYSSCNPVLTNCVIFNNFITSLMNANSTTTLRYSLFEPDQALGPGMNLTGPGNLTTTVSPFANPNSAALATGSSAINAGNVASYTAVNGPTTDLLGNPRIMNGSIDMGAVEFQVGGTIYTVQNGNWSNPGTWNVNRLPVAGESIGINHAVQVNGTFQIKRVVYGPGGRLIFSSGGRIQF